MLHLTGYNLSLDDMKAFRQVGSKTPGHPENHLTEGIEVSTGPLGQGISNAVGLAIAERHLAATFNRPGHNIVDHYTYVICGDGCLQEGVSSEACSLAGHLGLGKLIVLYDDNQITIDGETDLSFTEDVLARYASYGWHTQTVEKGDEDMASILAAIEAAKAMTDKPSIIKVRTTIGFGSKKQHTESVHGSPLGAEDIRHVKQLFGFNPDESFVIPQEVAQHFAAKKEEGAQKEASWNELMDKYTQAHPDLAAELRRRIAGELPQNWEAALPTYKPSDKKEATRKYSFQVLEKLVPALPELIGGSADLTPSTLTRVKAHDVDFSAKTPEGRYLRYGVREHGMCAINNGLAAHGGLIPFGATFLTFTGYCLGAVRLAALSHFRELYVFTHDSIGLGEDGPTHQPVEILATVRAIPNILVLRPADGNETSGAYKAALLQRSRPSLMAFSRQGCAQLEGSSIDAVLKGAYILQEAQGGAAKIILTGTGSEVELCVKAAKLLQSSGVPTRVVSFPSWELFEEQEQAYKESVFPPNVAVLSVEAGVGLGWDRYSHAHVGMTTFGSSGPGEQVFKYFGFTPENVADRAQKLLSFYPQGAPLKSRPF